MPVSLPAAGEANRLPPDAAEVLAVSRGVASAVVSPTGLTHLQQLLLRALFLAMTGFPAAVEGPEMTAHELAQCLARRDIAYRTRIVQTMILLGLVVRPIPEEVAKRIAAYSAELMVDEGMVDVARELAAGSLGLAAIDFERNGYTAGWGQGDAAFLHTSAELANPWGVDVADPALAARWEGLERLPHGSLGCRLTEFYRARGFSYPGRPGSAPPLLAQHDWVHVLADYGTTVESELEVFALIARANDDLQAFSLLAMVVSLFETGYLSTGAGLFEASPGHLSTEGMATRVADAMRRGALCRGSVDFLRTDWFELADLSVEAARDHFCLPPKAADAVSAGSVGPWEPGGISPFQVRSGTTLAEAERRPYESYGARVANPS